jgi:transcriptional regulator with XRE-family HTH domain
MPRTASSEIASQLLGAAIRDARKQAGLTQADLAERLQTSPPYVSSFENGKTNMTIGQLGAIADALGAELNIELVVRDFGPEPTIPELVK